MMQCVERTAYPELERQATPFILSEHYTPTEQELVWSKSVAHHPNLRLFFLVQLKIFQRLGYFKTISNVPAQVVSHIAGHIGLVNIPDNKTLKDYDKAGSRNRHQKIIRQEKGIKVVADKDWEWLKSIAKNAAQTKEAVEDIVNVMLEELVHFSFELPGLTRLMREARQAKSEVNEGYYDYVNGLLSRQAKKQIDELLTVTKHETYSSWSQLKREPKKPTVPEIRSFIQHVSWLFSLRNQLPNFTIPSVKLRQYTFEAVALKSDEMRRLKPNKRYALAAILIRSSHAKALDDIADVVVKIIRKMENSAQTALTEYILSKQKTIDALVTTLRDMLLVYSDETPPIEKIADLGNTITPDAQTLITQCDEHLAYTDNNYYPFLLKPYRSKRALLFACLEIMALRSSSTDKTTETLLTCLKSLQHSRKEHIPLEVLPWALRNDSTQAKWTTATWKKVYELRREGESKPYAIHRKFLELAIFVLIKQELSSGDLHVVNSSEFDNHKDRYAPRQKVEEELPNYAKQVQLPLTNARTYIEYLKHELISKAVGVDERFPKNTHAKILQGVISLKRAKPKAKTEDIKRIDRLLTQRLERTSIIDALIDVEHRCNLKRYFYPMSGHKSKLDDPEFRFVTSAFCYGCNVGPTQTANSVKGMLSPRQVAWLNIKHANEERLEQALKESINIYDKFDLPKYWGTGKRASVDGTKWDLYEQNLLSSYHIRYGGYGGIGYYHVSDTYIALFSHFIPCGVYEAVYILDGLMKNESDIQPDTIHGDTQAQSFPVFGLSHLLGINLMPRIRNIQNLILYRPDKNTKYQNIDALFGGAIDFDLIEQHLPDMLQIVISIKLGLLAPSTLLRRLGTYSRKNKVYFAFKELGKVIRTLFLLDYIDRPEVRQTIHAETNKSEEFNAFTKHFFFGDKGVLTENLRHQQVKIVKYNQLVANMKILYNTDKMTKIFGELAEEGYKITPEVIDHFSPYRTAHFNLLGDYTVDTERATLPFEFKIKL